MVSAVDARVIANCFMECVESDDNRLTPMQLLKLVYIAHGYYLNLEGSPLIYNQIEAWKYGPVIPDLYHALKFLRNNPVKEKIGGFDISTLEEGKTQFVGDVYNAYKRFSGIQLSQMTHRKGSPWHDMYRVDVAHINIPNGLIQNYYRGLLETQTS